MAGPAAAAGAKAAASAGGKAAGGKAAGSAASRSGSQKAAKGAAASRSAKAKGGGGGGSGGGRGSSIGNLISFPRSRRKGGGGGEPEMFSSGYIKFVGIAGGILVFFLLVIIAPLVIFDAAASSCGGPEEDQAVPIQTNHKMDPEDLSQTQIAIRIYLVGSVMHMTPRQIMAAYATAYVESNMTNIYGGDSDSRGIYQQRNFSPWTDGGRERNNIVDTTISFFLQLREYDTGQPIGILAAEVQKPAEEYEYRYALWVDEAHEMFDKIHNLVGTPKGIKKIENLEGVVINGSGLDALTVGAACSGITAMGPANLKEAVTLYQPRSYKTLPSNVWAGGEGAQQVDARIWEDAVWVMTNYHLRATAARETGHHTHGDGTALDMVPANGNSQADWDESALRLARDLGWTSECGGNGLSKAAGGTCDLVPSIIFVGYNGYEAHGDPAHVGSNAHIHVSWYSSCYGCGGGALVPPRDWIKVFPAGEEAEEEEEKKEKKEEREKEKKEKEREEKAEAKKPPKKGTKQKGDKA